MSESATAKCCDNTKCELYHGNAGKLRTMLVPTLPAIDLASYNEITIGKYTMTLCVKCEHAVDMFFGYYKHALTPNPKLK